MARDRKDRLEKQKLRQREYRARLKADKLPAHEDLARAVLDIALTTYLKDGRHEDLMKILDRVSGRLEQVGFRPRATAQVWLDLQDRYERGWSMLRKRCSQAELEAMAGEPETA